MPMIQVAFAGHNRADDLGHHQPVIEGLDAALALLKSAGIDQARLLTGLAPGADELAAGAWRRAELGPIHAVLPFLHDPDPDMEHLAESATWLDGEAAEREGRNPHLKQTRMVVETADLLLVVWTGERARGAGGTADAVRHALDRGLPVLWLQPGGAGPLRLIRTESLPSDFDFAEFQEGLQAGVLTHVEIASEANIREVIRFDQLNAPADSGADASGLEGFSAVLDQWLHGWLWKTYSTFRTTVGGKVSGVPQPPPLPEDLAEQPGFKLLTEAYLKADAHANRLAAVHRSEQILLVLAMVTAAVVGSLPALWPHLKLIAVCVELALGLAALWVWSSAAHARQHERWSEERMLAEQLRHERAGWALGVSLLSIRAGPLPLQMDGFGREILRDAGLPNGKFDASRVERWGRWAMSELVDGQSAYHSAISVRDGKIAHRIHVIENVSFMILMAALSGYLLLNAAMLPSGHHPAKWVSGVVTMIGTIIPAVTAAIMALEAKLEFKEQSERSRGIADRLNGLGKRLGETPSFGDLQSAARIAMGWHITEASHWREGASRRRLFRP